MQNANSEMIKFVLQLIYSQLHKRLHNFWNFKAWIRAFYFCDLTRIQVSDASLLYIYLCWLYKLAYKIFRTTTFGDDTRLPIPNLLHKRSYFVNSITLTESVYYCGCRLLFLGAREIAQPLNGLSVPVSIKLSTLRTYDHIETAGAVTRMARC